MDIVWILIMSDTQTNTNSDNIGLLFYIGFLHQHLLMALLVNIYVICKSLMANYYYCMAFWHFCFFDFVFFANCVGPMALLCGPIALICLFVFCWPLGSFLAPALGTGSFVFSILALPSGLLL